MTRLRTLSLSLMLSTLALGATAQAPLPAADPAPATLAAMPADCARPMRKDNHGAEKGMPAPQATAGPCGPAGAASAVKAKPIHDHGKFHKGQ